MALVNKSTQLVRCAVTGRGAEEAGGLVAPGSVRRILIERHEFQIVVAVLLEIGNEDVPQLVVGVPVLFVLPRLTPGAEVEFVDVERFFPHGGAVFHPLGVVELIISHVVENRCRSRPPLGEVCVWVLMIYKTSVILIDAVFVHLHGLGARHEDLPDLTVVAPLHGDVLPVRELADDRHMGGGRCVDPEHGPAVLDMGTQLPVGLKFLSVVEIVKVHFIPPCLMVSVYHSHLRRSAPHPDNYSPGKCRDRHCGRC